MTDTPVLLVRHGEVADAHKGTFYGGAEVPLSADGEIASLTLARELAARRPAPAVVVSSPLSRARAVADPLAGQVGTTTWIEPGLKELDRGHWTHLHHDQVEAENPGAIARYLADPDAGAAPGGETEALFSARVWSTLDAVVNRAAGRPTVVVSHGHVIRVILRRLLQWDAVHSLRHFVPYHAVVQTTLRPDGSGELHGTPESVLPEALRRGR
jgi:broad specificity phosphatase PhoE